jgi:hypothetical protein
VAKACSEGGLKAARATMKDLVKRARSAGVKFECDRCHSDEKDFSQLTKGAREKFAHLLAAAAKK